MFLGATNFKKSYKDYFTRFDKVYVHCEEDEAGKEFVKSVARVLNPKEVLKVSCTPLGAKDPSELHCMNKFDINALLNTAETIDISNKDKDNVKDKTDDTSPDTSDEDVFSKKPLYQIAEDIDLDRHVL